MTCEHCDKPVLARGWCGKHYQRWLSHGDPLAIKTLRGLPVEERFWRQVEKGDDCWLWTGPVVQTYGQFNLPDRQRAYAHRYAYELLVGPIPAGLELDHLCHDPAVCKADPCPHRLCVRPEHLEPVTKRVNGMRSGGFGAVNAAKTHCPQGHPYDAANTVLTSNGKGGHARRCLTCLIERGRRARPA